MLTDKKNRMLSEISYWIDKNAKDAEYHPENNEIYKYNRRDESLGKFKILKVIDNQANGMQVMAVAPVKENGEVDTSQIIIAYAGTNKTDLKDLKEDFRSVVLGWNSATKPVMIGRKIVNVTPSIK